MTGRSSRDKGVCGERELFALLSGELGTVVKRGSGAARGGGCDSLDIDGWPIECKRSEVLSRECWQQSVSRAVKANRKPVLFWRASRQPWLAFVDLHDLAPERYPALGVHFPAQLSPVAWCQLVRNMLIVVEFT